MNFLNVLINEVNSDRNRRGNREKVLVSAAALRDLIYQFQAFESLDRAAYEQKANALGLDHQLLILIDALYHKYNRDEGQILLTVMRFLQPLLEQKLKDEKAIAKFGS